MSEDIRLRLRMAAQLVEHGEITHPAWRQAVERVPRHLLVPRFYENLENGSWCLVDGADPDQRQRWLAAVYDRAESLVTEYDPDTGHPTSSATMPSIVLPMLETLDVQSGQRVLDVGTGSGYSTALLCEQAGQACVTSIDAGAEVARLAHERLLGAGYRPTVVCGDGYAGYAPNAPYDRLLSMVTVSRVPAAWVQQLRPGGVMVATLPWATARLVRQDDGSATGRFIAGFTFMWMRDHSPRREREEALLALVGGHGAVTRRDEDCLRLMWYGSQMPAFWIVARLVLWPFGVTVQAADNQSGLVDLTDHSWALIDLARNCVTQGGPRRLWDETEELYAQLESHGRPNRDRLGLTVRQDGSQVLWLDSPDSPRRWELWAAPSLPLAPM